MGSLLRLIFCRFLHTANMLLSCGDVYSCNYMVTIIKIKARYLQCDQSVLTECAVTTRELPFTENLCKEKMMWDEMMTAECRISLVLRGLIYLWEFCTFSDKEKWWMAQIIWFFLSHNTFFILKIYNNFWNFRNKFLIFENYLKLLKKRPKYLCSEANNLLRWTFFRATAMHTELHLKQRSWIKYIIRLNNNDFIMKNKKKTTTTKEVTISYPLYLQFI